MDTTRAQGERFVRALEVVRALGGAPEYVHLANSAGILVHPETHHTLVRSGIALYGVMVQSHGAVIGVPVFQLG